MITTVDGLRYGQLVRSTAGRDRNQYYGLNHPVVKPKRKNIKHLKIFMIVDREIESLLSNGEMIKDSVIQAAIQRIVSEFEEGDRLNG